jgi:hypothetical protein
VSRPQTTPAAPAALTGVAGVHNAPASLELLGGGASEAGALHCSRCNRPRLLGVGWCGTWCRQCLAAWIADGQPAPADTGRTGRTYQARYRGPVSR